MCVALCPPSLTSPLLSLDVRQHLLVLECMWSTSYFDQRRRRIKIINILFKQIFLLVSVVRRNVLGLLLLVVMCVVL